MPRPDPRQVQACPGLQDGGRAQTPLLPQEQKHTPEAPPVNTAHIYEFYLSRREIKS
jgi:hypothetical protein